MSFMLRGLCAQPPRLSAVAKELMMLPLCSLGGLQLWKTSSLCLWVFQLCFLASRVYILGVHSRAREMGPDGSDDPPFDKWHAHSISENQCAYVCLDVLICWVLSVSFKRLGHKWSGYLECQHAHFSRGESRALCYVILSNSTGCGGRWMASKHFFFWLPMGCFP